jgi:hypothetical protein
LKQIFVEDNAKNPFKTPVFEFFISETSHTPLLREEKGIKVNGFGKPGTLTIPWTSYQREAENLDLNELLIAARTRSGESWALTFTSHLVSQQHLP